jgi:hypothetical protein
MIMARSRHDGGDEKEHNRKETLAFICAAFGGIAGYGVVAANGMTANPKLGDYAAICGILIGVCSGILVYGLCLFFLRR